MYLTRVIKLQFIQYKLIRDRLGFRIPRCELRIPIGLGTNRTDSGFERVWFRIPRCELWIPIGLDTKRTDSGFERVWFRILLV